MPHGPYSGKQTSTITLRLDSDLVDRIKQLAKREHRSVNNAVDVHLMKDIDRLVDSALERTKEITPRGRSGQTKGKGVGKGHARKRAKRSA